VFYTGGVTEHQRKPLQGAAELREAAIFATNFSLLPTASVIEKQMFLTVLLGSPPCCRSTRGTRHARREPSEP